MLDCIIIGTGVAGIEAAINLKIRKRDFIIIGNPKLSDKIAKAPLIKNFLGLSNIKGTDLLENIKKQIADLDINITDEKARAIYSGDTFVVETNENAYESKTVILGIGVNSSNQFVNEENLVGKGISYCATCDGLFYKNKTVCVIGYNNESINDANYLSKIANKVYFIPFIASDKLDKEIIILNNKINSINGDNKLESITVDGKEIKVDGLFIIRDFIKGDVLTPGLIMEENHIKVNNFQETNIKGLFACGDITGKPYQYIKAAGEGLKAAFSVDSYINEKN